MVRVTLDSLKLSIHDDGISWQVGYYLLPITTTTGKSCIFAIYIVCKLTRLTCISRGQSTELMYSRDQTERSLFATSCYSIIVVLLLGIYAKVLFFLKTVDQSLFTDISVSCQCSHLQISILQGFFLYAMINTIIKIMIIKINTTKKVIPLIIPILRVSLQSDSSFKINILFNSSFEDKTMQIHFVSHLFELTFTISLIKIKSLNLGKLLSQNQYRIKSKS
uniref:Transmembrane domain-containing protein n=1 Tax=Spironucleus salmonicida TaxID=348837 RepID=V6LKB5_9EUKA|eukprot:EST44783.1 Transmembrane domain-containing protein [Spironucleus salmonicida]